MSYTFDNIYELDVSEANVSSLGVIQIFQNEM